MHTRTLTHTQTRRDTRTVCPPPLAVQSFKASSPQLFQLCSQLAPPVLCLLSCLPSGERLVPQPTSTPLGLLQLRLKAGNGGSIISGNLAAAMAGHVPTGQVEGNGQSCVRVDGAHGMQVLLCKDGI